MICLNGKELTARYIGSKAVSAVYYGAKLIWEAISSCFGSGAWDGSKPWSGKDAWRGSK